MPTYRYKTRDKEGREAEGEREAKDQYELAKALRGEGFTPLFISETAAKKGIKNLNINDYIPSFLQKVPLEEKLNFTRNTAVMLGAGVSLAKALEVMSKQSRNPKLISVVLDMASSIKKGKTFAESLEAHADVFPKFYWEMVRAGEKSGKLEESLKLIALQLKKDYALRRKIRSAMMYPMIIMIAMVLIGILMLIYVVPTLVSTFEELDVELPASTKFVILISQSLLKSGLIIFLGTALLAYLLWRWFKSEKGKKMLDWFWAHTPVIRGINQKFNAARTCRTLSSLLSSGVDILEALSITKDVLQNHLYQNILEQAKNKIQKGDTISKSFLTPEAEKLYPPLVGAMVAVGEETGELSQMLLRLAAFYESEVAAATKDISTIIEPVLMIIIGIGVGFFAISMISPMYNLVGGF